MPERTAEIRVVRWPMLRGEAVPACLLLEPMGLYFRFLSASLEALVVAIWEDATFFNLQTIALGFKDFVRSR
jgi:hypothetical protein